MTREERRFEAALRFAARIWYDGDGNPSGCDFESAVKNADALLAELDRTAKVELVDIEGPPTRVGEITTEELAHLRECKRAIETLESNNDDIYKTATYWGATSRQSLEYHTAPTLLELAAKIRERE